MTVTALGERTLGSAIPGVTSAMALALADIQAKVEAVASFAPSITPPSLTADLVIAGEIVANVTAAISVGLTPPSIDLQVSIMLDALAAFQLQLQILLELQNLLLASVHLYKYEGPTSDFGTEMQAELSGGLPGGSGTDTAYALTFIATIGSAITAMQALFATDP